MVFGCISAFIALHVIDLHYTMSYNSQNKHKKLKMELRRILFLVSLSFSSKIVQLPVGGYIIIYRMFENKYVHIKMLLLI